MTRTNTGALQNGSLELLWALLAQIDIDCEEAARCLSGRVPVIKAFAWPFMVGTEEDFVRELQSVGGDYVGLLEDANGLL
jgi:hypothetical protein